MRNALFRASMARSLFLWLLFASVAVWSVLYIFGIYLTQFPGGSFDQHLERVANVAAKNIEEQTESDAQSSLNTLAAYLGAGRAGESNGAPAFVMRLKSANGDLRFLSAHIDPLAGVELPADWSDQLGLDTRYRVLTRRLRDDAELVLAQSLESRWRSYNRVMFSQDSLTKPLLAGFLVLLIVVMVVVRRGMRPLNRLSAELSVRAPGDLTRLKTTSLPAELKPIVHAFNTTLDRLEKVRHAEQQFLADAAHELRTPIALVAAQVEAILLAGDLDSREQAMMRMHRGIDRANRLIGQLLALARLEASTPAPVVELDLVEMTADVLAALEAEATTRQMELSLQSPDVLHGLMQAELFEMLLGNLVSNAIRHSPGPGRVEVTLACADGEVTMTVCDNGRGIPPHRHSEVLRRFHRLEPQSGLGSGLGMAIAAEAVTQLNGRMRLGPGIDGRGLCVTTRFPLHAAR